MSGQWLFAPLWLPLFFGGLLLPWWQWRSDGDWPRPTPGGWLAVGLGLALPLAALLGDNPVLHAWLGGERPLPRALPAVWAIYGLPCWGAALAACPGALAQYLPARLGSPSTAVALVAAIGWALLLIAGLLQLLIG